MEALTKCDFCGKKFLFPHGRKDRRVMSGHLRHCEEYKISNRSTKRRALNPMTVINEDRFDVQEMERCAEQCDAFYDIDYPDDIKEDAVDARDNELLNRYNAKYKKDMEPSEHVLHFQENLLFLYETRDEVPFQTGWVRSTNGATQSTSWKDYVLINDFHVKHSLSIAGGDDLLHLISTVTRRQNVEIKLPRTMRSIR